MRGSSFARFRGPLWRRPSHRLRQAPSSLEEDAQSRGGLRAKAPQAKAALGKEVQRRSNLSGRGFTFAAEVAAVRHFNFAQTEHDSLAERSKAVAQGAIP